MKIDEIIPGCIGLLISGVPAIYLIRLCCLALLSRFWPSAPGRIVRSRVIPRKRRPSQASYDVAYEYDVAGLKYQSDRVRFGGFLNFNDKDAQKTVRRYPAGGNVTVYFNPNNPKIATLERRVSGFAWLWLGICLFVALQIAGALFRWWK